MRNGRSEPAINPSLLRCLSEKKKKEREKTKTFLLRSIGYFPSLDTRLSTYV